MTLDQFTGIVGNVTACNNLSFCDYELPSEGMNHNLALHFFVYYKYGFLLNVLIEKGSSMNVMPKSTLNKLNYQSTPLCFSGVMVKDLDGSRKSIMGKVDLSMWIRPQMFIMTFQVMDIAPAYSCLLGRLWIHKAGVVNSTLHQKLKFVKDG